MWLLLLACAPQSPPALSGSPVPQDAQEEGAPATHAAPKAEEEPGDPAEAEEPPLPALPCALYLDSVASTPASSGTPLELKYDPRLDFHGEVSFTCESASTPILAKVEAELRTLDGVVLAPLMTLNQSITSLGTMQLLLLPRTGDGGRPWCPRGDAELNVTISEYAVTESEGVVGMKAAAALTWRGPLTVSPEGTDDDGDGVSGACDNCWMVANADQDDADGDGIGDACDDEAP